MSKKSNETTAAVDDESQASPETAQNNTEDAPGAGAGGQVVLPNGVKRIDFIRDAYYGENPDLAGNRSAITKAINEMLKDDGRPDSEQIPYQIVFSATKDHKIDPRIESKRKAEERRVVAAKRKADQETEKAEKKAEKEALAQKAREAEASAAAETATEESAGAEGEAETSEEEA